MSIVLRRKRALPDKATCLHVITWEREIVMKISCKLFMLHKRMCISFPILGVMDYRLHWKLLNIFKEAQLLRPQKHREPSH